MAEFAELENVVDYKIFIIEAETVSIEGTLYDVLSYAQSLIGDYIWQNDCFHLKCAGLEKPNEVEHFEAIKFLEGSTYFGDNIEDEWFIVYLLFSITERFPHLAATIRDNDGEFLLIEAADYLPKWLQPETSENRTFIHQGKFHIIPLPSKPSEITTFPVGKPSLHQALKILKTNADKTIASPWIQDPILKKIEEYPMKARDSFHNVLCYIPLEVKYLLETKKSLISPAVLAYVNQDPVDTRACQQLTHFKLDSLVPYRVCFTKCLYSQLIQQNFIPGKRAMKFLPEVSSNAYKGHLIGLQLTHGFEILYNQPIDYTNGNETLNISSSQQWEKYLESLTKHGYFQNEVVGSQLYTQLLKSAKEYFTKNCLNSEQRQNSTIEMKCILENMPMPDETSDQSKAEQFLPDDDESWLNVSFEELDSILSRYGENTGEDIDLKKVVKGMNSFVERISSYEGVEFPTEVDNDIKFDPDGFMKSLETFTKRVNTVDTETISDDDLTGSDINDDDEICQYASAMDHELSSTNVGKSFIKIQENKPCLSMASKVENPVHATENDKMTPVDIDLNLVQNLLKSYSLQEGLPGPVSNILNTMGIVLPENNPEMDD